MIISTTGCSRSRDNRSIPRIMRTLNQPLQECRASWRKSQKLQWEAILVSRNSSKKGRKIELIWDNKWSTMGLQRPLDKIQPPKERLKQRTPRIMAGILKLQGGPTASFRLPCSNRFKVKTEHLMEHTAEVRLKDKSPRATEELKLANPSVSPVETSSRFPNQKLRL